MATGEPFGAATLSSPAREDHGLAVRLAGLGELLDAFVVGGEQRLERRAGLDLMHEGAGGAVGDLHALAGVLLVALGDLVEGVAQACGGGDGRVQPPTCRFGSRRPRRARVCAPAANVKKMPTSASRSAAPNVLNEMLMTTSMPIRAA